MAIDHSKIPELKKKKKAWYKLLIIIIFLLCKRNIMGLEALSEVKQPLYSLKFLFSAIKSLDFQISLIQTLIMISISLPWQG